MDTTQSVWLTPQSLTGLPSDLLPRWLAFRRAIGPRRQIRIQRNFGRVIVEGHPNLLLYARTMQGFVRHGWLTEPERVCGPMRFVYFVTEAGKKAARSRPVTRHSQAKD